jgi:hypothetical protein
MFSTALKQVAAKGAELARELANEAGNLASAAQLASGPLATCKFTKDYRLGTQQTGSAGGMWRIFAGTARAVSTPHTQHVSVWVLDKRELQSRG